MKRILVLLSVVSMFEIGSVLSFADNDDGENAAVVVENGQSSAEVQVIVKTNCQKAIEELKALKAKRIKEISEIDKKIALLEEVIETCEKNSQPKVNQSKVENQISEKERFVQISAGEFIMGSPPTEEGRFDDETLHKVTISEPFLIQSTELTQKQWMAIMRRVDSNYHNPSYFKGDNRPVESVSYNEIVTKFLPKLNELSRNNDPVLREVFPDHKKGAQYDLPTEAQWEYAARGRDEKGKPTTTAYSFGNDQSNLDQYAVRNRTSGQGTAVVGSKEKNSYGLFDMHGNVCEWVKDAYQNNLGGSAQTDPLTQEGSYRVFRGGGWGYDAQDLRSANRSYGWPVLSGNYVGFRLLRTP